MFEKHTTWEKADFVAGTKEKFPNISNKDIAKTLNISEATVSEYLMIHNLPEELGKESELMKKKIDFLVDELS